MKATFDPRPLYLRAVDQFEKLAAQVAPAQLDGPTPCDEFTVRGLLGHVIGATHRIAYIGEGGRGMDLPAAAGEIDDTDWAPAVGRARARAAAAWADDAKLDRTVGVPWGEAPGRIALSGYVMETVTHTWDLARAVAPGFPLDEELAAFSLDIAGKVLPAEPRGGEMPFGPVQPVPEGSGAADQLAGWLGRQV